MGNEADRILWMEDLLAVRCFVDIEMLSSSQMISHSVASAGCGESVGRHTRSVHA